MTSTLWLRKYVHFLYRHGAIRDRPGYADLVRTAQGNHGLDEDRYRSLGPVYDAAFSTERARVRYCSPQSRIDTRIGMRVRPPSVSS